MLFLTGWLEYGCMSWMWLLSKGNDSQEARTIVTSLSNTLETLCSLSVHTVAVVANSPKTCIQLVKMMTGTVQLEKAPGSLAVGIKRIGVIQPRELQNVLGP